MSARMMPSNYPPFGKEEELLHELISQQKEQLSSIAGVILSKKKKVASHKSSLAHLEASLQTACDTLGIYESYGSFLDLTKGRFNTLYEKNSSPKMATPLASFLVADVPDRAIVCTAERKAVKSAGKELCRIINGFKDDIRCTRHLISVEEMSLKVSLLSENGILETIREIEDCFRAIKRVPDEIWLQILMIAVDEANELIALSPHPYGEICAAVPLSQVCATWRGVMLHSPGIWTTVHSSAPPATSIKKRSKLMDRIVQRAKESRLTLIDKRRYGSRMNLGCWWWPLEWDLDTYATLRKSRHHITLSRSCADHGTPIFHRYLIHEVFLSIQKPDGLEPLSPEVAQALQEIPNLTLHNIILRPLVTMRFEKMTELEIVFDSQMVLTPGRVFHPYALSSLLSENLRSLHLSHFDSSTVMWQGDRISLLNLHSLWITPHESHLVEYLDLPSLKNLTIALPHGPLNASSDVWVPRLAPLCKTVETLTFDWTQCKQRPDQASMVPLFIMLQPHTTKLDSLTFIGGAITGGALCDCLEEAWQRVQTVAILTIKECVGLSRADCERLEKVTNRLNVYRTFHRLNDDVTE